MEHLRPKKIDLSLAEEVVVELFDDDRWVKELFAAHLNEEIGPLTEAIARVFQSLPKLNDAVNASETEQAALVQGFAFGVIDDVLVSTKLLFAGKMMPAGNLMRQAIEGIAVAVLCCARQPVIVAAKKNHNTQLIYWQHLKQKDPRVQGHKALGQLSVNRDALGVSGDAVERLKRAQQHYHQFSHPSLVGIATRVDLGGDRQVYAGGSFDIEKLEGYRVEVRERIGLCSILPSLYEHLAVLVSNLPVLHQ